MVSNVSEEYITSVSRVEVLKMEAICPSKMLVATYMTYTAITGNPDNHNPHSHYQKPIRRNHC
jgi:hypothetical protein